MPHGTIRATVLIETLPAAFEMDEILYELRDRLGGPQLLGAGTTSSASSRSSGTTPPRCSPIAAQVTMEQPFLRAYSQLLIKTCHRRGAHAMGGMAAQIPIKDDADANERGLRQGPRRQAA